MKMKRLTIGWCDLIPGDFFFSSEVRHDGDGRGLGRAVRNAAYSSARHLVTSRLSSGSDIIMTTLYSKGDGIEVVEYRDNPADVPDVIVVVFRSVP